VNETVNSLPAWTSASQPSVLAFELASETSFPQHCSTFYKTFLLCNGEASHINIMPNGCAYPGKNLVQFILSEKHIM
jgi:hypothetical protein